MRIKVQPEKDGKCYEVAFHAADGMPAVVVEGFDSQLTAYHFVGGFLVALSRSNAGATR